MIVTIPFGDESPERTIVVPEGEPLEIVSNKWFLFQLGDRENGWLFHSQPSEPGKFTVLIGQSELRDAVSPGGVRDFDLWTVGADDREQRKALGKIKLDRSLRFAVIPQIQVKKPPTMVAPTAGAPISSGFTPGHYFYPAGISSQTAAYKVNGATVSGDATAMVGASIVVVETVVPNVKLSANRVTTLPAVTVKEPESIKMTKASALLAPLAGQPISSNFVMGSYSHPQGIATYSIEFKVDGAVRPATALAALGQKITSRETIRSNGAQVAPFIRDLGPVVVQTETQIVVTKASSFVAPLAGQPISSGFQYGEYSHPNGIASYVVVYQVDGVERPATTLAVAGQSISATETVRSNGVNLTPFTRFLGPVSVASNQAPGPVSIQQIAPPSYSAPRIGDPISTTFVPGVYAPVEDIDLQTVSFTVDGVVRPATWPAGEGQAIIATETVTARNGALPVVVDITVATDAGAVEPPPPDDDDDNDDDTGGWEIEDGVIRIAPPAPDDPFWIGPNSTFYGERIAPWAVTWLTPPPRAYSSASGTQSFDVADYFAYGETYAITGPSGVSINASTGRVTVSTSGAFGASPVTVIASNAAGSTSITFDVAVLSSDWVIEDGAIIVAPADPGIGFWVGPRGTIYNQEIAPYIVDTWAPAPLRYGRAAGTATFATAGAFAYADSYAVSGSPAATINAATGVLTIDRSALVDATLTVTASNGTGSTSFTIELDVYEVVVPTLTVVSAPTIAGSGQEGFEHTATPAVWSQTPAERQYEWLMEGVGTGDTDLKHNPSLASQVTVIRGGQGQIIVDSLAPLNPAMVTADSSGITIEDDGAAEGPGVLSFRERARLAGGQWSAWATSSVMQIVPAAPLSGLTVVGSYLLEQEDSGPSNRYRRHPDTVEPGAVHATALLSIAGGNGGQVTTHLAYQEGGGTAEVRIEKLLQTGPTGPHDLRDTIGYTDLRGQPADMTGVYAYAAAYRMTNWFAGIKVGSKWSRIQAEWLARPSESVSGNTVTITPIEPGAALLIMAHRTGSQAAFGWADGWTELDSAAGYAHFDEVNWRAGVAARVAADTTPITVTVTGAAKLTVLQIPKA